jgi:hypothetical protein
LPWIHARCAVARLNVPRAIGSQGMYLIFDAWHRSGTLVLPNNIMRGNDWTVIADGSVEGSPDEHLAFIRVLLESLRYPK